MANKIEQKPKEYILNNTEILLRLQAIKDSRSFSKPETFGLKKENFKNKNVLDLGCGSTGYLQKAMEKLECNSVTCSDLGNQYIEDLKKFAKKNLKKKNF